MSGEKILVIDDRRENLLFLANSVLRPEGYEVITAMDGKQGLDKALAEKPNLIITDLKMPRMSGLELMGALRKANSDIPVILTTFYGSEQAAIEAFRLGARDYIIKPYEVKDMLDSVERALIEHRLRRESLNLQNGVQISQHLEERVRQLHSLCGIGRALATMHDQDEAMRVIVEAAIYLTSAETGQLCLFDHEKQQLQLRAVRGRSDDRARCIRQLSSDQVANQVVKTGKAFRVERKRSDGRSVASLVVPLRTQEKILGCVGVDAKADQAFHDNDQYLMGLLADLSAAAMINTRLVKELRDQIIAMSDRQIAPSSNGLGQVSTTMLNDSIHEAERISQELRSLAAAAQVLAARLQMQIQECQEP